MKRFKYSQFNNGERRIIRTLRRFPKATIVCLSSWDIDGILGYLDERGYQASPKFDKNAQYFTERTIDEILHSNILVARILKRG